MMKIMGAERSAALPVEGPSGPSSHSNVHAPSTTPAQSVHKFLDSNLELVIDEIKLQLSEQTDFTVVGMLGGQGVGKSTIASLLAGAGWSSESRGELHTPPFLPQGMAAILQAAHQTTGVDIYITPERLILLDTQSWCHMQRGPLLGLVNLPLPW